MLKRENRDHREIPSDEIIAFLGKGTEFKGVITYQGTVRIDGRVEGEIITEGTLIVGESAAIQAEVVAGTVVSSGKITGNVNAREKVQLLSPAVLDGSIKAPLLVIEEGVRFNGQCQMAAPGETSSVSRGTEAVTALGSKGGERAHSIFNTGKE
jgi:cytoskeletal protein CcmA (bactofilin family)